MREDVMPRKFQVVSVTGRVPPAVLPVVEPEEFARLPRLTVADGTHETKNINKTK